MLQHLTCCWGVISGGGALCCSLHQLQPDAAAHSRQLLQHLHDGGHRWGMQCCCIRFQPDLVAGVCSSMGCLLIVKSGWISAGFFLPGRWDGNKLFFVMATHHGLMLQDLKAVGSGCPSLPVQVLLLLFSVFYSRTILISTLKNQNFCTALCTLFADPYCIEGKGRTTCCASCGIVVGGRMKPGYAMVSHSKLLQEMMCDVFWKSGADLPKSDFGQN